MSGRFHRQPKAEETKAGEATPAAEAEAETPERAMEAEVRPCAIFLNGFPGVGKLTIAKLLQQRLGARLIDNHLIADLASAIEPSRGPAHNDVRRSLRRAAMEAAAQAEGELTFVMTECLASNAGDASKLSDYMLLAQRRSIQFVFINLTCDEDENTKRLEDPERAAGAKGKLTDAAVLRGLLNDHALLEPRWKTTPASDVVYQQIDISAKSAADSAEAVMQALRDVLATSNRNRNRNSSNFL